jgi:hypothetical protein
MAVVRSSPKHSTDSTNLADLLERVLDKGVVIAGDIKVSLLDIELLTIQIRLVVCSIDKAKEMGMDWWANTPVFMGPQSQDKLSESESPANPELEALQARVKELEATLAESPGAPAPEEPRFRRREESA